jgi:hypothetical protein
VNALELSNVAATLASGGTWCPPNPIVSIQQAKRDQYGNRVMDENGKPALTAVPFTAPKCEQVVEAGLANTLANAMSEDDRGYRHVSTGRTLDRMEPSAVGQDRNDGGAPLGGVPRFHQPDGRGIVCLQRRTDACRNLHCTAAPVLRRRRVRRL